MQRALPRGGLHEFEGGPDIEGFAPGDEVAPGVAVQEVGAICPDECALHIAAGPGALACADGVVRWREGDPLGFVRAAARARRAGADRRPRGAGGVR